MARRTRVAPQLALRLALALALLASAPGACKRDAPPPDPAPAGGGEVGENAEPDGQDQPAPDALPEHLARAVAHPDRPVKDRERDPDRKPGQVLEFFGVEPGMTAVDLMSGTGYYAQLLAHAVGPEGKVIVQNSPWVLERFAEKPLSERLAKDSLGNAERLDTELDQLEIAPGTVNLAVMVLFYHDTYWMEVDRKVMNKRVFDALAPGGRFAVIDHHSAAGAGDSVVQSLHRGDAELIKSEILAAGFELEAESDLLRHPEDDRTRNVFEPELRGKTDRFIFKFRKPAGDAQAPE